MAAHQLRPRLRRLIVATLVATLASPAAPYEKSFIPIPEIVTDPNEGATLGLIAVVLFLDEQDHIRYMLAPDFSYNKTKGFFPTFRLFGYPAPERRYSVVLGKSTTKDQDYELEYTDRSFWEGRGFVLSSLEWAKDSTERFFGFGNDTPEDRPNTNIPAGPGNRGGESNYTSNDTQAQITPGVWLLPYANLSYRMRIRRFSVETGQVSGIPFIGTAHPETRDRGLEPGVYWAHQIALTYDSRDSTDIPTHGALAFAYTEVADRALGSSTSFIKFGADWRDFIPLEFVPPIRHTHPILALRAVANYVSGSHDTPFWEMSSIGGRRTLRGYGSDRFIDFNRSVAQAEVRTRVWDRHLFGVNAELEVAPFVETGQVFHHVATSPVSDLHWVGGLGFRGVVRPQIVGFVDAGMGSEGLKVFTGIEYPF
jgi:outer membrane protein assembly factor BamA